MEPPITTTDTTSPTLNLEADDSSEAFKKLEANTRRIVSNISRIPLYVAENAIGFASALSPEVAYSLQKMSPEERDELRRQGEAYAFDPFQAAGGGIAKLAGDPSGAMLESMNPDSQGLRSLKKRVKTI